MQESLVSTLEEIMSIQEEGRMKRRRAEEELVIMEGDLKRSCLIWGPAGITARWQKVLALSWLAGTI